jgi:hypothetical protein
LCSIDTQRTSFGSPGDEDLLPEQPVVLAFGHRAGTDLCKVGACLGLGENHGAGPLAAHHLREECLLLIFRPTELQRVHGTVREHRTELECEIGGCPDFLDRGDQHLRHGLATVRGIRSQLRPTAFRELPIGIAEPGCGDNTFGRPTRALLVARPVDRGEDGFGEPRGLAENRFGDVARIVGQTRIPGQRL